MFIYECPISHDFPLVPVITNEGITYDFSSIARSLLRGTANDNSNAALDPITGRSIDTLIYNRSTKELNDMLMEAAPSLSDEDRMEIASLYAQLVGRYPALRICGLQTLEGMEALIGAPRPAPQRAAIAESIWNAAYDGSLLVVRDLLAAGRDRNQANANGATPLYVAAQNGHLPVVDVLLEAQADINQAKTDGATPLYVAAHNGHLPVVEALLKAGADINQATTEGVTPLLIAAQNGHLSVVNALLEARADINQAMTYGVTPLFIAAQNGHLLVITALLAAGAGINQARTDGVTPLIIAAQDGHLSVVNALLEAGADINQAMTYGVTPLFIAAQMGHLPVVNALLEAQAQADINQADAHGATPLIIAAQDGHLPVVEALLEAGADINLADENGATPLFIAAQNGHLPVVNALLAAGADVNKTMTDGATALYTAVLFGHFEVVQALLRYQHLTMTHPPISIATEQGYPAFVKALLLEESVRDYYLNQIILKPELMHNTFTQNPVFFTELAMHGNALWGRLSGAAHFNLAPDAHKTLLQAILNSRQMPDETQRHPLCALFSTPQPTRWFSFFGYTVNITLDDIQAYTEATYSVPTSSMH